jgi:membrane protein insertase Oxa1/YidC/SpoIIIJ
MPILFALILYNRPSGLTLYITTSSALGMFEQWMIRRKMAGVKLEPVDKEKGKKKKTDRAARRASKSSKEKGWFGKLMEQVEKQQRDSQKLKKDRKDKK